MNDSQQGISAMAEQRERWLIQKLPIIRTLILLSVFATFSESAVGAECYETSVVNPVPYQANGGELIQLSDGTIWQDVGYNYLYLYEYYPTVIVCPNRGFMILDDQKISIIQIK